VQKMDSFSCEGTSTGNSTLAKGSRAFQVILVLNRFRIQEKKKSAQKGVENKCKTHLRILTISSQ
jgi:hypothetical protein